MKKIKELKYVGFGYLLSLLIIFCLIGSCTAGECVESVEKEGENEESGTDINVTLVDEDSIQKPTWVIGDNWCLGYTMDFSDLEDEIRDEFETSSGEIKQLDIEGEIGMYQSAKVVNNDVVVNIDGTEYMCYKVFFEQYVGGAFTMKYDLEMQIPDYSDYEEDDDYYEDDYYGDFRSSSAYDSEMTTITMKLFMYMEIKGDIVGDIYYTVEDLAVAKGTFSQIIDAEVEMDMSARMGYEEYMDMDMEYEFFNVESEYVVEYNPPLDIFDFPIEPDEYWSASSSMTTTLNKISGRISYVMSMKGTEYPATSMRDDLDLTKEISTPDTYGPVSVTYYFHNPGTISMNLLEGIKSECIIIEPDEDYWYHDYDEYDDYDGYDDYDDYDYEKHEIVEYEEVSSTSLITPSVPFNELGADEFDAESIENPVEASAMAKNYYSEDEGNIVSYEPSSEDGSGTFTSVPYSSGADQPVAVPKTYEKVTNFKSEERDNLITKYSHSSGGGGDKEDDSTWTVIITVITIALLVFIIAVVLAQVRKKRRVQDRYRAPVGTSTHYPRSDQAQYSQQYNAQSGTTQRDYQYSSHSPTSTPTITSYPESVRAQAQTPTQVQPYYQSDYNKPDYYNAPEYPTTKPQSYDPYESSRAQTQYSSGSYYQNYPSQSSVPTTPGQQPRQQTTTMTREQQPNYPTYNEPYDPRPKYNQNSSEYNYNPYNRYKTY